MNKMLKGLILAILLMLAGNSKAQSVNPKKVNSPAISKTALINGQKTYMLYCLSCHQADGGGVPNMNPPLSKTTFVLGNKTRLIQLVLNGLSQVDIDGQSYTNNMPAQAHLKDQEIADVLTYIRNNFANKASAISAAEVKSARMHKSK